MGLFTASLYHKEQKQTQVEVECGNCRLLGHVRRECTNEPVCYDCLKPGHKRGSILCVKVEEEGSETESSGDEDGEESNVVEEGAQKDNEHEEEGSKGTVIDTGDPKDKAEKTQRVQRKLRKNLNISMGQCSQIHTKEWKYWSF